MTISEKIKFAESLLNTGQYAEALQEFKNILEADNYNYQVLNYIAITYSMLNEYENAIKTLEEAINQKPSSTNAYLNLAIILFQNGNKYEALKYYKKVIDLDPDNSTAYYNYAVAFEELGKYDEAIVNYEKAIERNKKNYFAYHNWGLLNLLLGNYQKGWEGFEYRDKANVLKERNMPGNKWNGEQMEDKVLYVYSDQGFGDTIQFLRFLSIAKEKVGKLIFECQPSLFPLLKNQNLFDEIVRMNESLEPVKQYDYYLPVTSLGKVLKIYSENNITKEHYICVSNNNKQKWSKYFDNIHEKKIGIIWRSNSNYKYKKRRSIELNKLEKIFSVCGYKFYSLQMEPTKTEKELLNKYNVIDLSIEINNFKDTAEIVEELNLIVSTDTAVPHLAGAMGKEVWLMLSKQPDWRWQLNKSDSFWYPSLNLFRQSKHGNWGSVIDEVFNRLNFRTGESLKEKINMEIFTDRGIERFKEFLFKIKEDTYPETPMEIHTQISDNMISQLINKISLPDKARILDIGCGQGLGLKKFKEFGLNPVGITLNTTDYEVCRDSGYEVYQMDQSFLNFNENEFDLLWARHVLEHSIFPYYTLHEYNRVLKKNGIIYVEVPAAGFDAVHENNPNHYSVLTKTMWRSLFNRSGFDSIYELDFDLDLEKNGKDQYWMFLMQKRNEE